MTKLMIALTVFFIYGHALHSTDRVEYINIDDWTPTISVGDQVFVATPSGEPVEGSRPSPFNKPWDISRH